MKHNTKVTLILLALFLVTQFIGLVITSHYSPETSLPFNIERPDLAENTSGISIFFFILVATALALILLHYKLFFVWRIWFFLSVLLTLIISFAAFIPQTAAIIAAIIFAAWRLIRPNVYIQNGTELFIYGALAALFAPLLSLWAALLLLIFISLYDYIAVRKTKHMVKLAKSQGEAKVFAGLVVPYEKKVAILGGGDMGFPLILAATAMLHFKLTPFQWQSYLIPLGSAFLLFVLFVKGDKKKFYPAMPFVTLGCILGLGILLFFV